MGQRKIFGMLALLVALTLFTSVVSAHPNAEPPVYQAPDGALDPEGIVRLMQDSDGAQVEIESATGAARFVRLQGAQVETLAAKLGVHGSFTAQADAFFAEYGSIFGIRDAAAELVVVSTTTDKMGETHLTYQQVYQGVPIFAGTLRVHLDAQNRVKVVNGAFVPEIALNVKPSLSAAEAEAIAVQKVAGMSFSVSNGASGVLGTKVVASTLYVYHDGLIRGVPGVSRLVYEVEVSNGYDVREFVYVDAHKGDVVNQITGIQESLNRRVYSSTTANLLWEEGDAYPWAGSANVTDTLEVNAIITTAGHTYNLFFNAFGFDSYDGGGATMIAIFADADLAAICPNAHWNGEHIGFCRGEGGDDVIAHELGHAYTQYTDNLIYQWQPGALNESYSDIWGETVDLTNNFQTDTPDTLRIANECSAYGGAKPPTLYVSAPAGIAGDYPVGGANFNPALPLVVTETVVLVDDGDNTNSSSVTDGCEALVNAAEVDGHIALVDRGSCTFSVKVMNAQDAGAVGVIVVNDNGDSVMTMGGDDPNITIPSVFLGQGNGDIFKAALPGLIATIKLGGIGTDDSIRWLMGEDAGGAIRDMWTPSCFGHPDKVTDVRSYYCGTDDQGGVHTNAGVPNHAFALLVDGGTYNGQTVAGIGIVKAAHIYWRAQSVYQIPVSDFSDHADALEQSCEDLRDAGTDLMGFDGVASGEVIAQADCDAVTAAIAAVELRTEPTQCNFQPLLDPDTPQVCSGGSATPFYSETFDTDPGGAWALSNTGVYTTYTPRDWVWAATMPITMTPPETRSGGFYAFDYQSFGDCNPNSDDQSGVMYLDSPLLTVPAGVGEEHLIFTFDHYVATEANFDGGNVWINVNGSGWQLVDAADFVFNSYNAALVATNPLDGQPGFSGTNDGTLYGSWGQSHVDLANYATEGDQVQLRFAFGVDGCNGIDGWYLDQVEAYYCVAPEPDIVVTPSTLESEQFDNTIVTLPLTISNVSSDAVLEWEMHGVTPEWAQPNEDGNAVINGYFTDFGAGVFNTDDFILDFDTTLTSIGVGGGVLAGANLTTTTPVDWYIYADDSGQPSGYPGDGVGDELWHYASTGGGAGVSITANGITLDLVAAGQDVQLPSGAYWLVAYPSYSYSVSEWYWLNGVDRGAEGLLIDPADLFGAGATSWTPQTGFLGWSDLQFTIEGTTECTPPSWLGVSSAGGSVARNAHVVLDVDFDSTGMAGGVYASTLCVNSNDPDTPLVQVPVTMTVDVPSRWTGAVDSDWANGANWTVGVPGSADWASIDPDYFTGAMAQPAITGAAGVGSLVIEDGGELSILSGGDLSVESKFYNYGLLIQEKSVLAATDFHIYDAAASQVTYYGIVITPTGAMGSTSVSIAGNQPTGCTTTPNETALRCIDITPATSASATVKVYYEDGEIGTQTPATALFWHYDGAPALWSHAGAVAGYGAENGYQWIEVTGVSSYSPFVIKSGVDAPTAVSFLGVSSQSGFVVLFAGLLGLGWVYARKRR